MMNMVDGKAIVYRSQMLQRTCCRRWHMLYHIVPRLLCCPYIQCMSLVSCPPQGYLPMVIQWAMTTGLLPFQIQPETSHEPWSSCIGKKPKEEHQDQGDGEIYLV